MLFRSQQCAVSVPSSPTSANSTHPCKCTRIHKHRQQNTHTHTHTHTGSTNKPYTKQALLALSVSSRLSLAVSLLKCVHQTAVDQRGAEANPPRVLHQSLEVLRHLVQRRTALTQEALTQRSPQGQHFGSVRIQAAFGDQCERYTILKNII